MSVIGTSLASSVSASQQAARAQTGETQKEERNRRGPREARRDTFEHVEHVERAEAPPPLASNDREEAHEDRQEHAGYYAAGDRAEEEPPRIDVKV